MNARRAVSMNAACSPKGRAVQPGRESLVAQDVDVDPTRAPVGRNAIRVAEVDHVSLDATTGIARHRKAVARDVELRTKGDDLRVDRDDAFTQDLAGAGHAIRRVAGALARAGSVIPGRVDAVDAGDVDVAVGQAGGRSGPGGVIDDGRLGLALEPFL